MADKTTPRGASATDKKKRKKKKTGEAQRRLFDASANSNNNAKESIPPDNSDATACVTILDSNDTGASVVLVDDDDSMFNSGSMATVSQVDHIEVNSQLNPTSAGARSQVSGEVLGGYELQSINPSDPLDFPTGDWADMCDQDWFALQNIPEETEGDEDAPVKVTSLVRLILNLSLGPKLFFPFLYFGSNFYLIQFSFNSRFPRLIFTIRNNFFELNFYSPF